MEQSHYPGDENDLEAILAATVDTPGEGGFTPDEKNGFSRFQFLKAIPSTTIDYLVKSRDGVKQAFDFSVDTYKTIAEKTKNGWDRTRRYANTTWTYTKKGWNGAVKGVLTLAAGGMPGRIQTKLEELFPNHYDPLQAMKWSSFLIMPAAYVSGALALSGQGLAISALIGIGGGMVIGGGRYLRGSVSTPPEGQKSDEMHTKAPVGDPIISIAVGTIERAYRYPKNIFRAVKHYLSGVIEHTKESQKDGKPSFAHYMTTIKNDGLFWVNYAWNKTIETAKNIAKVPVYLAAGGLPRSMQLSLEERFPDFYDGATATRTNALIGKTLFYGAAITTAVTTTTGLPIMDSAGFGMIGGTLLGAVENVFRSRREKKISGREDDALYGGPVGEPLTSIALSPYLGAKYVQKQYNNLLDWICERRCEKKERDAQAS